MEQRRETKKRYRALAQELDDKRTEYVQDLSKLLPKIKLMNEMHGQSMYPVHLGVDERSTIGHFLSIPIFFFGSNA
jgi:hypothetical protein